MKLSLLARSLPMFAALHAGLFIPAYGQVEKDKEKSTPSGVGVEKAMKYYDALTKRPAAGYLFDRFFNSWVDAQTIEELEKFLKEKASATDATTNQRLVLAFFYAKQNEHSRALEQFRLALEKDPGNADAWFQKANAEVRTLDFEAALKDLTKALESKPTAEMTRMIRQLQGRLLARVGKNDEAMKAWQELLALNPSDEDLQEDLIELQINEGLNKEALITAEALLTKTKDPYKKVQRRLRIGDIQSRLGNREQSIAAYAKCLDEVGGDSWLEKEILEQIEQTYRRDDAIEDLKKEYTSLVAKYPQRLTLRRSQARLMAELGDFDAAVKTFQEILALSPGDREVREAYVALLAESKKLDEAVAQLKQLVSQHPQDGELLIKLADLYFQGEKPQDTQKTLEEFLGKSDQSEQTFLRVAGLLERFKLNDASLALYKTSTEKFPDSEAARESHASALHKQGKKEEAIAAWKKMAEGGDKTRVMNVARQAAARDEHALAYELLSARKEEFSNDALFLSQFCEESQRVDKVAEAIPQALKLVSLAQDAIDLDTALSLASKLIERAEQSEKILKSLQTATKNVQEKCLLAELLERSGDSKTAESLLREVAKEQPEMGTALLVRLQTSRGDFINAAESLRQLVESPGGRKPVHIQRLTEMFEKAGQLDKALQWIPEWKKLTPGSTQAWLKEADLQASLGKMKEALLSLRQAAQQFDGNEDIRAQLGAAYRSEGKLADAERVFTQLFEEAKDNSAKVRWAGELAQTATLSGKVAELIESFEERRRSNRTSILPLLALAEIHRVTDNYEGRRQSLLEAARIKRDDIDLLMEISRIAETQGEFDQALQTLREAQALDKTDKVKQRIVRVLFAAGKDEEAKKMLFDLAGGPKMDARNAETMAESFINQDAWAEAAEFLAPFVAKFPKDYRLAYQRAVALEESDQKNAALAEFQRMLSMTEELPQTQTTTQPTTVTTIGKGLKRQNDWVEMMRPIMPAGALSFLELSQFSYQAMSYKNRNNGYSRGGAAVGTKLQTPMTVEDAPKYALSHIAQLAESLDEAAKKSLEQSIKSQTRIPVELLSLLQGGRFNYSNPDFTDLLDERPNDENIASLAALYCSYQQNLTEEHRLRLFKFFKEKRPLLSAICVISQGKAESEELKKAFAEAVDLITKEEKPIYLLIDAIGRVLNVNGSQESTGEEEDAAYKAQIKRLRAKLLAWYRAEDQNTLYPGQLLNMVIADLVRQEDPAELLALMEAEIVKFAEQSGKSKSQNSMNPYMGYGYPGGRQTNTIAPATFPPASLPEFPPMILMLLGDQNNNYYTRNWQPDADKLKAALPGVKNQILKALLANKIDDEATVTAVLQEMASKKEPTFSMLILASTWAAQKERFEEAVTTLHKAEYLPLTKEQRRTVDASILAWTLQKIDADGKPLAAEAPVLANARDAALRLRRDVLSPDQKQELADAMEKIGLEAEAKRLTAAITSPPTGGGGLGMLTSNPRGSSGFNPGSTNRVDSLLQKGKADQAVKLWQKQLRDLSKSWTASFDDSLQYQAQEWVQTLRGKMSSAEAELLKGMTPASDSTDAAQFAQAAAAAEIFGKKKEAKEYYTKALKLKPKDQNLRLIFVLFLMKDEPNEAASMLSELDTNSVSQAGSRLSGLIDNMENNQQRCNLAKLVAGYLKNLKPAEYAKTDLSWLQYFIEQFARYGYDRRGNDSLPSLYLKQGEAQDEESQSSSQSASAKKKKAELDALQTERRKIHDELCQLALPIPQLARFIFGKVAALELASGKQPQDLVALAKQSLQTELGSKAIQRQQQYSYGYSSSQDEDSIDFPTPEELLLEAALKTNQQKLITEEILPMLKTLKATQAAKDLEEDAKLYFSEPSGFLAAAEAYVKRRSGPNAAALEGGLWVKVIRVMELRKLKVALDSPILAGLKKGTTNYYGGSEMSHVTQYAKFLLANQQQAEVRKFLDQVAAVYLGPEEKRAEYLKKNFNSNYSSGSPSAGINKWLGIFRNLGEPAEFFFLMLDHYNAQFKAYVSDSLNTDNRVYFNANSMFRRSNGRMLKERALAVLKASPFLKPAAEMRLLNVGRNEDCIFQQCIRQLRNGDTKTRQPIIEELQKMPKNFGTELTLALLVKDSTAVNDALGVLGAHLPELKALPEKRQNEWAGFYKTITNTVGRYNSGKLPDAAKAGMDWLDSLKEDAGKGKVEALLAAKNLQAIQTNEYGVRELLEQLLPGLLAQDPATALAVTTKVRELVATERRLKQNSSYSFGDGSSAIGYALASVLRNLKGANGNSSPKPETVVNALDFYAKTIVAKPGHPVEYSSMGREAVVGLLGSYGIDTKDDKKTFNTERFITELGTKLDPDAGRLYFTEIGSVLKAEPAALLKPEKKAAFDWIAQQAAGKEPYAWLAKIALQNLTLAKAIEAENKVVSEANAAEKAKAKEENRDPQPIVRKGHHDIVDPAKLSAEQKAILDIAQTESWSTMARLAVFHNATESLKDMTEPAVRIAAAKQLLDAWKAQAMVASTEGARIIRRITAWAVESKEAIPEEVKSLGRELLAGWKRAQLGRNGGSSSSVSIATMLELACAMDDASAVNQVMASGSQSSDRACLAKLITSKQFDAAKRLLTGNANVLFSNDSDRTSEVVNKDSWQYNETLAAVLPEFLKSLESPTQQYTAEVLLASLPTSAKVKKGALPERKVRLAALAKRFTPEHMNNPELGEQLLQFLLTEDATMEQIDPELLKKIAETISLGSLPDLDNSAVETRKKKLVMTHLTSELKKGNLEPLAKSLADLADASSQDEYDLRQLASTVNDEMTKATNSQWEKFDAGTRKKNREMWRTMLFNPKASNLFTYNSGVDAGDSERLFHVLLLHALDDAIPEFNEAFAKLEADWKEHLSERAAGIYLDNALRKMDSLPWPKDAEALKKRRSELFVKMLQCSLPELGGGQLSRRYFQDLVKKSGLLTREDLMANIEKFSKSRPRGGATLVEWAELLVEDKKKDLAVEKLKQSESAEADPKPNLVAWTAYIRAQAYQNLELIEPAIKSLKSIAGEVRKELTSERANSIESCDKLLKTLEQQFAINQGNVEVVLASTVETLTKQPESLESLTELATNLENIGKAYAGKKEFDKAIPYFGASMLAFQAVRTVDEKHSLTNLNRLNNSYHQARRDKGDPAAPKAFLVRREAKWKYLDGGSVAPEKWNQPDFDASQWKEGLAPLGYGDKDLGTSIEPGGDKKNRPITCYFRTTFEIPENTPLNSLLVNLRRDDGVVLYLNGVELLRDNMPDGTIKPETLAKTRIDKDESVYLRHDLKAEHVKIGTNTLAAEVHQGKADSSDLGLDVELVMNPSFPVETVKSLDKAAIMKTLGAIWDKLPEATRTLLTTEPK